LDLTEVDASDLSALPSSVVRVVTERDTADGNAHALAQCVGTAPPSGIGASTVVLVEVGAPKIAIGPGKMTIGDEVAVEWTLIQVAATNLSMPSCSLAEVVTESGSSSGAKGVQRDVAEYATGRKGDEDVATATLPDCVSSADLPVYNVVTVEMVTGQNYTCQVRPETTLAELKLLTHNTLGLPTKCLQFVLVDKTTKHMQYLKDEMNKLANYGIEDSSTLYLILRLRGGGRSKCSSEMGLTKLAPDTGLRVTPMIPPRNLLAIGWVATCTVVSPQ